MAEGILVILEHNGEKISRLSLEAITAAQKMGAELSQPVFAAVLGKDTSALAAQVSDKKLDKLLTIDDPALENYTPDGYVTAGTALIESLNPAWVLFGHSYQVRDFAPALAARSGSTMLTDCIGYRNEGGKLVFTRQMFGGKFNADYSFNGDGPFFLSFQAGSFNSDELEPGSVSAEAFAVDFGDADIRTTVLDIFQGVKQEVDLSAAEIIVSAGRGLKEKDNLELVQQLADALGGEVAASRPVCDDGWLPVDRQIGSSGQTVAPKLYLAVGISGAIQHVVGMKGAKYIVAINKDPHAPIFEIADVAVVADLFEVVPELTKAVKEVKG